MDGVGYEDSILIVGAGVFGLSTAIHLARRGYRNVKLFDRHPYDKTRYSYFEGADAASADINKIVRSAYGGVSIYQELTLEAIQGWNAWNEELATGTIRPPGMTEMDRVFLNNGNLIMTDGDALPDFDQATVESMERAGHVDTQLITTDPRHCAIAKKKGLEYALDPFRRTERGKPNVAVLDTTGGTAVADKACRLALQKARDLGVHCILDPEAGALETLVYSTDAERRISGIVTRDGKEHRAALTVLACGGWTGSLVTQLDGLCEATAGSVALIKIPRSSPLWHRFSPSRFPSWVYKMRDGESGGLYGFARNEDGWLKIGYRGTKYTYPVCQRDGKERSVPITRWSAPSPADRKLDALPEQAVKVIQDFMSEHMPELAGEGIGISKTRLCWYNDSFDNHLLIDHMAGAQGLMIATAGSGHAFKYLPIIGKYIVDRIEGIGLDRDCMQAWKWRQLGANENASNVLLEGSQGSRALRNVKLVSESKMRGGVAQARL